MLIVIISSIILITSIVVKIITHSIQPYYEDQIGSITTMILIFCLIFIVAFLIGLEWSRQRVNHLNKIFGTSYTAEEYIWSDDLIQIELFYNKLQEQTK